MPTRVSTDDVQARLPFREISSTSEPSKDDVEGWLDTAESRMVNTLASVGITAPTTGNGAEILKELLTNYGEGRVRRAYAAAGGDGNNDDGKDLLDAFEVSIKSIRSDPQSWAAELAGTPSPGVGGRMRGPSASDTVDPQFTTERGEDQW
jgi:hypothetical protein